MSEQVSKASWPKPFIPPSTGDAGTAIQGMPYLQRVPEQMGWPRHCGSKIKSNNNINVSTPSKDYSLKNVFPKTLKCWHQ